MSNIKQSTNLQHKHVTERRGFIMCFIKIKRWLALRKAKKLENEKILEKKDIIKENKSFFQETQTLKKLVTKGKRKNIEVKKKLKKR